MFLVLYTCCCLFIRAICSLPHGYLSVFLAAGEGGVLAADRGARGVVGALAAVAGAADLYYIILYHTILYYNIVI